MKHYFSMPYFSFFFVLIFFCSGMHTEATLDHPAKLVLITGCGRSGTTFMSSFLCASGLKIPHERPGRDGCVAWPMCVDSYRPWGNRSSRAKFQHVFHQVRNPLDVISSWFTNGMEHPRDASFKFPSKKTIQEAVWDFIQLHVPEITAEDEFLTKCAKYWYY
jgi:hypothetical protein